MSVHRPPLGIEQPPAHAGRDLLRTVAAGTANAVGETFFRSLTRHLATAFDAEVAFVTEVIPARPGRACVLASWQNGVHLPEGSEFEVAGTPCELGDDNDLVFFSTGAREAYPADALIDAYGLDSYLAVAMRAADGSRNGHIAVASSRRIEATEDDKEALAIFAARAAAEVDRRRQEESLRDHEAAIAASRMRIVQAAEDERRRIGRTLHDGAQQRLVAIGHFLDVAQKKLGDAAPDATPLVGRAREEAREAGRELRELARGLNPASLTERGLDVALATLAGNCPLPVKLEAVPERRLPDPMETALYYLVSEALTNAVKHANASAVRVSIALRDRAILAEVSDDGDGGVVADGGSGLRSLGDRIAALGGTLSIDSPPGGGTRLVASIPTGPW